MPHDPLQAHSTAEVALYLMLRPCPACGQGPVRAKGTAFAKEGADVTELMSIVGACDACSQSVERTFRLIAAPPEQSPPVAGGAAKAGMRPPPTINPTREPSRILDVTDWLTLAEMLSESADREPDRAQGRQLRIEAGLCLDEALKFFEDDENDLPPESAFFGVASHSLLRNSPQRYSRQRITAMRFNLPR